MPRSLDMRPQRTDLPPRLGRSRPPAPIDNGARIFVFCCALAFLAIAGLVVTVVVKFLI
jgi:hypothetical protein